MLLKGGSKAMIAATEEGEGEGERQGGTYNVGSGGRERERAL